MPPYLDTLPAVAGSWMDAFTQVPRRDFIPGTIWQRTGGGRALPLHRALDPQGWQAAVDADAPVITQVDDGQPLYDGGTAGHRNSSSSSMPTVMAVMLNALAPEPDQRVMEIGTGTGWNTALLAYRLGAKHITTIEVDPVLAERAQRSLLRAGYPVMVITGDGTLGSPSRAPFARVLSTAGVTMGQVPYAWIEQTVPGGRVVMPWGTRWLSAGLLALTVHGDGSASGRIVGHAAFMPLRAQRVLGGIPAYDQPDAAERTTGLHPWRPTGDHDGCAFAVSLRLPDVEYSTVIKPFHSEDAQHFETLLWHCESRSWALVTVTPTCAYTGEYLVRQWGPRRLWDEVEAAHDWWMGQGRPDYRQFGVTVTPDGQQVWLGEPTAPLPPPSRGVARRSG